MALLFCSACKDRGGILGDDSGDFDKELLGILVAPEEVIVPVGTDAKLTATGLFEDRTSEDITALVSWSSTNAGTASVSDGLDQEGTLTGNSLGEAAVSAVWRGIESVPVKVTVTDAELLGLTVEPRSVDAAKGDTVQLKALAAYSNGTRADSSSQVRWITDDGTVAQLELGGMLTAAGVGQTTIRAEWEGTQSQDVPVTVVQSAKVDLQIADARYYPGDDEVTLTITVENAGSKGASEFWVDVWVDYTATPQIGDIGDYYDLVPYVGAKDTAEVTFVIPLSPGSHTAYVLVDSDNSVQESNENNNVVEGTINLDEGVKGPNLEISYFQYIADGDEIYYVVDITNSGAEDVGTFYVDLFVDPVSTPKFGDTSDYYVEVDGLKAGATEYADFLVTETCWRCYSYALVDSDELVNETNEDDNLAGPLIVESE